MLVKNWPDSVKSLTAGQRGVRDKVGQSGSQVWLFEQLVLKTGADIQALRAERDRLIFLNGRLPVPQVVEYAEKHGRAFLLTQRLPGRMLCDEMFLRDPQRLVRLLADACMLLAQVDCAECCFDAGAAALLTQAHVRVQTGRCSVSDAEPGTYGPGGFANPAALFDWLCRHVPSYTVHFVHGDCCLPNILVENDRISGFVDVGRCGKGDMWQDLALCVRSLRHNLEACLGHDSVERLISIFLEHLGLAADSEKIRYYILLDELF